MLNVYKYFSRDNGFDKYTPDAVSLLKETIHILDRLDITYCLIAGTLLGHVRHNGEFIPWDDDIDLIVDDTILKKLNYITLPFHNREDFLIKISLKDFPFVDLFVYKTTEEEGKINFFGRDWDYNSFFPVVKQTFMGIPNVSIPRDPHYFLKLNYGDDYMEVLHSSIYLHKYGIETTTRMQTTLKDYIDSGM